MTKYTYMVYDSLMIKKYHYNQIKNQKLKMERGVCFDEVIAWIEAGKIVAVVAHPNQEKYPEQEIYIIENDGYAYNVPFVVDGDTIFLKTIFPSRKATKRFLKTSKK